MDFEKEVIQIVDQVPLGCDLAPETAQLATAALKAVDGKYGPDGERPLEFHNAPHSVGVTRRAVRLTNILYPHIHPDYRDEIYDLAILGGAAHDYDQDSGPGPNEVNSMLYAVGQIETADGQLNETVFKERLAQGILATQVEMRGGGELVQTNLQIGSYDPIKFIMAFSDINGIAMEGDRRMVSDATNLYHEITDEPTADGLCNFIIDQAGFLKQRLNDGRIKSDIAYYFPNDIEDVFDDMYAAFHGRIVSAHGLAIKIGEHKELQKSIAVIAKGIGAASSSTMGTLIGRALHSKLARDN